MFTVKGDTRQSPAFDPIDSAMTGVGQWVYDHTPQLFRGSCECCRLRSLLPVSDVHKFSSDLWWQGVHQDDRRRVDLEFDKLLSGAVSHISIRYRLQQQGTQPRWILTRATLVSTTSRQGQAIIQGLDTDVTELYDGHSDNERLLEIAERSKLALDSAQQGIWQLDFRLGINTESNTWRTMRGYPADSAYSSTNGWREDIHPDDVDMVLNPRHYGEDLPDDTIDYHYRQRHASGAWRWIWSRGKVIERDAQGQPLVFIGTDTDITQIKEAELRYERLSNTLEIAIQAAGMGVWEWTLNAQANVWDQRTREIFGTEHISESVAHHQFMELVHPDDREALDNALRATVKARTDINVDYRIIHPEKGIRFIKAKAQCHSSTKESPRYVGIVWDITDMVHAEQERSNLAERLSHAQRLQSIGELTGGIAHDFNNLLAIISGNAELLSLTSPNNDKYLNAIVSASQRGAVLTRGLLAFSRKQALRPTSVNLGEVVNNLCVMLDRTLGSTISLNSLVRNNLWHCEADPVQVENALINLIVNARDAMPDGGTITIESANCPLDIEFASLAQDVEPGDFVKVSITDTGAGMSANVISKSVDPFFTTKVAGEGHGLGLSMVFGFIKQSHGHMTIDSVENRGTTVSLYFPRFKGVARPAVKHQSEPYYLPMGRGESILLVEDDSAVQDMIRKSLEYLGYDTLCVASGAEALLQLSSRAKNIDLVITDIVLTKGMDGFELGQALATRFSGTRIVYISGYAQDALQRQNADQQGFDVLEKPFSLERLAIRIAQHLRPETT